MSGIFISYRRDDTQGWAGRLADSLRASIGRIKVFRDIDDIPPGAEFDAYIRDNVAACRVLLVLIGPKWMTLHDSHERRRIDDPKDFIRIEIIAALEKRLIIIPILIGNTEMPREEDLPEEIKGLSQRQAYRLSDEHWNEDILKLSHTLKLRLGRGSFPPWTIAALIIVATIVFGAIYSPDLMRFRANRVAAQKTEAEKVEAAIAAAQKAEAEKVAAQKTEAEKVEAAIATAQKAEAEKVVSSTDILDQIAGLEFKTSQNPGDVAVWIQLGNLCFDAGLPEKAIAAYDKALAISPDNADVLTDQGVMYSKAGKFDKAIQCFDKAVAINPKHEVAWFNKGIVLMHKLNDPKGAIQAWEELMAVNPLAMAPNGQSIDEMLKKMKQQ